MCEKIVATRETLIILLKEFGFLLFSHNLRIPAYFSNMTHLRNIHHYCFHTNTNPQNDKKKQHNNAYLLKAAEKINKKQTDFLSS